MVRADSLAAEGDDTAVQAKLREIEARLSALELPQAAPAGGGWVLHPGDDGNLYIQNKNGDVWRLAPPEWTEEDRQGWVSDQLQGAAANIGTQIQEVKATTDWVIAQNNAPWVNLSLASGISGATQPPRVRRAFGRIWMAGIANGSFPANSFKDVGTIPAGYRPTYELHVATGRQWNNGVVPLSHLNIMPTGLVQAGQEGPAGNTEVAKWVDLNNISWADPGGARNSDQPSLEPGPLWQSATVTEGE
jgi:hypothetical protein